ncbi:hypothetical protein KFF05_01075 [bacterium SCSIO 12827]|nr:hypothetical protein KFF05_01075 [bacterium SCSIO 12827]
MGTALIAGMLSLLAHTATAQDKAAKVMGDMDADGDGRGPHYLALRLHTRLGSLGQPVHWSIYRLDRENTIVIE